MDIFQESSDMHTHNITVGQYTNLLFQSNQLGLTEKFPEINRNYAKANVVLGYIPKVTPSSKVVGDLAKFMVSQDMLLEEISNRSKEMAFPERVV